MNVLFITIAWPKPTERNLYSDLMDEFKERGHDVFVLSGVGHQISEKFTTNVEDGIKVLRVKTGNIVRTSPIRKFLSLISLGKKLNRAYKKYLSIHVFDLILFNTPPVTLSGFLRKVKRINNTYFYLLLKDIWPQGFADLGVIQENGFIWKYFKYHEKRVYKNSDYIGCMSPLGVDYLIKKNPYIRDKVEVCPNAIKLSGQTNKIDSKIRIKYNIPLDSVVFLFSGNLGKGHGLDFLVKNIISLSDYKKAFFLIGGAGTHFNIVKKALSEAEVSNAYVYNYLPKSDFEKLNANCDVGIILLDKSYSYPQFPSRLLAYLTNRMAVLCSVNRNTDIGEIVVENQCGLSSLHGDDDEFQRNVKLLCTNPELRYHMGKNAWSLLERQYDVKVAYEIISGHLNYLQNKE